MKLKNIYLIRLAGLALIIGSIFLAVVLNASNYNIINLQKLYMLMGVFAGAIGFIEIADLVKLGFGITRFTIYRRFTITVILVDLAMLMISILFVGFTKFADSRISLLYFFDYRLIIYFTLVIYFLGQLGMFLGNIKIPDYLKLIFLAIFFILIGVAANIQNKFLINTILIISNVSLSIANFIIIKNIKLEINL